MGILSRALKQLFASQPTPSTNTNDPSSVRIVDVSRVAPPASIPHSPNHAATPESWLGLLEIPYERRDMRIPQVKTETLKLYEALAQLIDKELRNRGGSLSRLRKKLNQSYDYYGNVLYTIYCIAEGEVVRHYTPRYYDNSYSYQILQRHTDEELAKTVRDYARVYTEKLPMADVVTREVYGLTVNGLERVWWDMDGVIREKYKPNHAQMLLLRLTPGRSTRVFEVTEVRMQILAHYLSTVALLHRQFEATVSTDVWAKRMVRYLSYIFDKPYNGLRVNIDNIKLLNVLLKLCEQAVRENTPYAKPLKIDDEITYLNRVVPKPVATSLIQHAATIATPIKYSDEALEALRQQNPQAWRSDVEGLEGASLEQYLKVLNRYRKDYNFLPIAKNAARQAHNQPEACLLAGYAYYCALGDNKPEVSIVKMMEGLIRHPEQREAFYELVRQQVALDKVLASQLRALTLPPRRTVILNREQVAKARAEHEATVQNAAKFLGEDQEPESAPVPVRQAISMDDLFGGDTVALEAPTLSADQADFLAMLEVCSFELNVTEAESFAKSKHKLLGGLLQSINQVFYEYIDDQLLSRTDDKIVVEDIYRSNVKEALDGYRSAA